MKVIFDAESGTVINLDNAFVVDINDLSRELGTSIEVAAELLSEEDGDAKEAAEKVGVSIFNLTYHQLRL